MHRVADYSIVADGGVVEFTQDTITFEVPAAIDSGLRSILGFKSVAMSPQIVDLPF